MSKLFIDGALHYGSNYISKKYSIAQNVNRGTHPWVRRPYTAYLMLDPDGRLTTKAFSELSNRVVVGNAIHHHQGTDNAIQVYKGATCQLTLRIHDDGALTVHRGDETGDTLASAPAGTIAADQWSYLELDATIDNASGAVEVRLNGSTVDDLTLTGTDTQPGAATGCDRVSWHCISSSMIITDIYVDSDTLTGDCIVDTIMPNAAGDLADFVPSTGDNWENVDDSTPDDDATFNSSQNQGDADSFEFQDLSSIATSEILAVAVNLTHRKDDVATRQLKALARIGTTTYPHTSESHPSAYYSIDQSVWEDNPDDSEPWEEADVNGAQFGYQQNLVS